MVDQGVTPWRLFVFRGLMVLASLVVKVKRLGRKRPGPAKPGEGVLTKKKLMAEINRVLRDEKAYAETLRQDGDWGRAKLALAAIEGVNGALRSAAAGDDQSYSQRLLAALDDERQQYRQLWEDDDGIGTSTFARVLDLVEGAA